MTYATTTQLNFEIARAKAAEKALSDRLAKLEAPVISTTGKAWTAPLSVTTAQIEAAIRDLTIDTIVLPPGCQPAKGVTGDMPSIHAGVDRSSRPLTIIAPGLLGSPGIYYDGQWNWYGAKSITYDDQGMASSGYQISQAGFHGIGGSSDLTIRSSLTGVTLSPTTAQYKTWGAYISGARNDRLAIDFTGIGQGHTWSGVQIDSTTTRQGQITVRVTATGLALAFYENVPTDALDVTAVLTDSKDTGTGRTGAAVIFHQATGKYRVTKDALSGGVVVNQSGMVAA